MAVITTSLLPVASGAVLLCGLALAQPAENFDRDGNGLLDDGERNAFLAAIVAKYPAAEKPAPFDMDGDGKVTLEEMTTGRHPLQQVIAKDFAASPLAVVWTVDAFPEWLMNGYFHETAADGVVVASLSASGITPRHASQPDTALQPRKADGGILFPADSGAFLRTDGYRDTRWDWRWMVFTFRIDGATGSAPRTDLVHINKPARAAAPGTSSPYVWFEKGRGLIVQYTGLNAWGIDIRRMTSDAVIADGKTCNTLVAGIRQGRMFAALNGVALSTETEQPPRYSSAFVRDAESFIGAAGNSGNAAWTLDALVFGQSEISEATVRKLSGWGAHRTGTAALLPPSHPYRDAPPLVDAEDFPRRYLHDAEGWGTWLEANPKALVREHSGEPRVTVPGFERVWFDDFRASRLSPSTSGAGDLWQSLGFNTAVGMAAPLIQNGVQPDAYPYDADRKLQALSLIEQSPGRWRGSALYTVNDCAQGYAWAGPKIFRIRCMFPKEDGAIPGGLFPAFWSYGTEWLVWRTSNRIENDWWEFDGKNALWMNGMSTHIHYPHVKNAFTLSNDSYKRAKIFGAEMTEERVKLPGGIRAWDGEFHTWEYVIDTDMTYVNFSYMDAVTGAEKWIELWRCKTSPTYLEPQDLQLDYALKGDVQPPPQSGRRYDFVVDFVEVLQKTADIERVPAPFTTRPSLTRNGATATVAANAVGVTDLRYYWFADGYPLTYNASATFDIPPEYASAKIRCMVKAVGWRDQPEAWSNSP